jgi:hypothetical protein
MSASDEAAKRLWLRRVLGLDVPEDGVALTRADVTKRLMTISQDAALAGVQGELAEHIKAVAMALRADAGGAVAELDGLEARAADLQAAGQARALAPEADATRAAAAADDGRIERLRAAIAAARADVAQVRATLGQACSAYAELIGEGKEAAGIASGDEDDILTIAAAAGGEVPLFEPVADMLDDIADDLAEAPDEAARQALAAEAIGEIEAYRAQLTDPILSEMENTEAGAYRIRSAIDASLDALAAMLNS